MSTLKKIVMKIIGIDNKIRAAHPIEIVIFVKRNPESNHTMKYVIVLIAPHQYFQQVTHYQKEKDNRVEEENTRNLNPHHHLLLILVVQNQL